MTTYRDASPADAAVLERLFRATFTATFGHLYAPHDLDAFLDGCTIASWNEQLADPAYVVRLAERDGGAVGFAKLGPPSLPGAPPTAIELRQLYLAEAAQGSGVAPTLMDWVLATARARGAAELWLSVFVENHRARRFYARFGFEDVGPYTFMVGAHADEDRLMRLKL